MGDTARPYGAFRAKRQSSAVNNGGLSSYKVASGYNTAIAKGDFVALAVGGTLTKSAATTAGPLLGVAVGFEYTDPILNQKIYSDYLPAGTVGEDIVAIVDDDPAAIYQIQADGTLAQNAIGTNAAIVQGAITAKKSRVSLGAASIAATATLPLRIVGFADPSEVGSAYPDILVRINAHFHAAGAGNAKV